MLLAGFLKTELSIIVSASKIQYWGWAFLSTMWLSRNLVLVPVITINGKMVLNDGCCTPKPSS